jgi:hypothetical protein
VDWATIAHPCTNGQVEHTNDMILQGLKACILTEEDEDEHARLSTRAGKWVAEVPSVLWSLWTTPNRSTNFTPFFMVYEVEAMLPTKLQCGFPRAWAYQPDAVEEARKDTIDSLKESRDITITRLVGYQQALRW